MSFSTDPRSPVAADKEAQARRVLLLFAASLVLVGLCGLVAITVFDWRSGTSSAVTSDAAKLSKGLGPQPGDNVAGYLASRSTALAAAKGNRTAVVSLPAYVNEARARATVGQA
ncbi:MAG: hypothetical protein M3011_08315, partial [Actinomycetota bacterium]|nr:hypothetical protein [Actinomycetota bacterium]